MEQANTSKNYELTLENKEAILKARKSELGIESDYVSVEQTHKTEVPVSSLYIWI